MENRIVLDKDYYSFKSAIWWVIPTGLILFSYSYIFIGNYDYMGLFLAGIILLFLLFYYILIQRKINKK